MTESEVVLNFNPSCHITIDSLPRSDLIMVGADSGSLQLSTATDTKQSINFPLSYGANNMCVFTRYRHA